MEQKNIDKLLLKSIKTERCSECITQLKNTHIGLIKKIYFKYAPVLTSVGFSQNDFEDEIEILIFNSARKFDLRRKGKFSSYLANQVRFFCLNKITELKKSPTINTEPKTMNEMIDKYHSSGSFTALKNSEDNDFAISIINQITDKRIRYIFQTRYIDCDRKMTFKEIGKKLKLSSQTIINLHNKGIKLLKDKLVSENIFDNI